jgi:hypothetical protein
MRLLLALAATAAIAMASIATPTLAADEHGQTFDAGTYRIFYAHPRQGAIVPTPVRFSIRITGGYVVNREKACQPAGQCYGQQPETREANSGHCHTYVEDTANPGVLVGFNARCDLDFTLNLPAGRSYCAYADLTHHDHVARFKNGPQVFPGSDKVCFRVRSGR